MKKKTKAEFLSACEWFAEYTRMASEHREMSKVCRLFEENSKAEHHAAQADKYASMAIA